MTISILLGTTKGAFVLRANSDRSRWSLSGPHCDGWPINHVIGDPQTGRLWAAGGSGWNGAGVWRSDDDGATWALTKLSNGDLDEWLRKDPEMAVHMGNPDIVDAPYTGEVEALWVLSHAHGRLLAGGKPGVLFHSSDDGDSFEPMPGINHHAARERWQGGGAGLVLHTIVPDQQAAKTLWVGISAVGVFGSDDGGASWEKRDRLSKIDAPPHVHADGTVHAPGTEVGSCVHNMVQARDDMLYQQNHEGVFRSADGGRSWADISHGLPSRFGFPIAVHPHDPRTIWVIPMNGDSIGRYPPDAVAKVWKSTDAGDTWSAHTNGLPAQDCYFTVLRQAMAVDRAAAPGLYFGTNSGSLFASLDGGETWAEPARHLPTILSVETLTR